MMHRIASWLCRKSAVRKETAMREPWWRKQTQHWYLEVDGKQVRISKTPDPEGGTRKNPPSAVQKEWHRIEREGIPQDVQVGDLFAAYLTFLTGPDVKESSE